MTKPNNEASRTTEHIQHQAKDHATAKLVAAAIATYVVGILAGTLAHMHAPPTGPLDAIARRVVDGQTWYLSHSAYGLLEEISKAAPSTALLLGLTALAAHVAARHESEP